MRFLIAAAAAIVVLAAAHVAMAEAPTASQPAPQTDDVAISSAMMYDACIANNQGPPTECACMAGFYGSRLNESEFRLLAVVTRFVDSSGDLGDVPAAQAAVREEANRIGLSPQAFNQAMQRFTTMDRDGLEGDRICRVLANR